MLTPKQANERVAAGIAVLNKKWRRKTPWWELVDLKKFTINDERLCVLGQLYGSFYDRKADNICDESNEIELGFVANSLADDLTLERAWIRAIRKLRKEASA
jgi:hypothetical protein